MSSAASDGDGARLADCQILLKLDAKSGYGLRASEGDGNLVLWDFHDLLFHARSTEGRQANPIGGAYTYAALIPPLPRCWLGQPIFLRQFLKPGGEPPSPFAKAPARDRQSVRDCDDAHPVTLAELARLLDPTARVLSEWKSEADSDGTPELPFITRPYPSAGSAYELELYLLIANCEGLPRGFYHYDAGAHALVAIAASAEQCEAMLAEAEYAMDAPGAPQVLITIAARLAGSPGNRARSPTR